MLFLVCRLGEDRYAVNAQRVAEVLPLVRMRRVPGTPAAIAGVFLYRGVAVPALDLKQLLTGTASEYRTGTRVLVADCRDAAGSSRRVGLIAERTTETIRRDPGDFIKSGVAGARGTGHLTVDRGSVIQLLELDLLISAELAASLDRETAA